MNEMEYIAQQIRDRIKKENASFDKPVTVNVVEPPEGFQDGYYDIHIRYGEIEMVSMQRYGYPYACGYLNDPDEDEAYAILRNGNCIVESPKIYDIEKVAQRIGYKWMISSLRWLAIYIDATYIGLHISVTPDIDADDHGDEIENDPLVQLGIQSINVGMIVTYDGVSDIAKEIHHDMLLSMAARGNSRRRMESEIPGWDADTKWPESALSILNDD